METVLRSSEQKKKKKQAYGVRTPSQGHARIQLRSQSRQEERQERQRKVAKDGEGMSRKC